MKARVYLNLGSRLGDRPLAEVVAMLSSRGVHVEDARVVHDPSVMRSLVTKATLERAEAVVIGGGDGTVSLAADIVAGSASNLGVLPLGTGNALARDLGIPLALEAACDVVAKGRALGIDVGRIGAHVFVNVASIGVTTDIVRSLDKGEKRRLGRLAYVSAILRSLRSVRPFHAVLTLDGERHEFESILVVVGVGRTHAGPFAVARDASPTDGKGHVYAVQGRSPWKLATLGIGLALGRHTDLYDVFAASATQIKLETEPGRTVTLDGEPSLRTPVEIEVIPRGLHVFVP